MTQVVDAPDPSVIIAALNRVAEEMAGGPDTDADPVAVPPQPAYPEDASIADVSLPDLSLPDLSMDAFAADPPELSTFSAFTPVTAADATTAGPLTGSLADSLAGTDKPGVDDRPKGWDPIRVSAAWPAIGSDTAAPAAAGAATGSAAGPVVRQSAWSRGVNASGEPAGVARPGSRARALIVAVVLVCVLAVVLAIFA